ncbi:MAG: ABC transporter ATP-binding protein [Clostridiales bacterium]|nr:ABC transporter ATP-binding protein [Clostridiales bacterium]
MDMIRIDHLEKTYGNRKAVDGLSLSVQEGELFALLGQNGAGKTTTIRMLCGLALPTGGDAFLAGHSIVTEPEKVHPIINVSPQETAVSPRLTVEENLRLMAELYGFAPKEAARKAEEMMERFSMTDRRGDRARNLSGGLMRKLSIAMALISGPKVLFLDEPTLGLDVRARRELWKMISDLKGAMTIVLTTHYLEEAEALADHIAIMEKGRLKALGTLEELQAQTGIASLEDIFLSLTEEA